MIYIFLVFLVVCAILVIHEKKLTKGIIYLSIFSLIASLCFLLFSSPDVALAEAVIGVFATIILVVSFEKYFRHVSEPVITGKKLFRIIKQVLCIAFSVFLFVLFLQFIPENPDNNFYLKYMYLERFAEEIGGENAVTAIYLGYRVYDTLFEALILLVSIMAIIHLSWYGKDTVGRTECSDVKKSDIATSTIRVICPVLVLFGIYIITHGHLSPGGGFQGGVIVASLFICRYFLHGIYDLPIDKIIVLEKMMFIGLAVLAAVFISLAVDVFLPEHRNILLIMMNLLIGMKVACGFIIIFYRFIVFERM